MKIRVREVYQEKGTEDKAERDLTFKKGKERRWKGKKRKANEGG